jgi:hypothetical protein
MLYREIIAVCSEIHTRHINTLCGQNVEFLNFEAGVIYSKSCTIIRDKFIFQCISNNIFVIICCFYGSVCYLYDFYFYHIPSCYFGSFLSLYIWLYVLYTFVSFCKLYILIVMFM